MLRITNVGNDSDQGLHLRLEGQVAGPWVDAVRRACDQREAAGVVVLDLTEVSFIDPLGVALFRDLAARHVRFTNGSPFVNEQLREVLHGQR